MASRPLSSEEQAMMKGSAMQGKEPRGITHAMKQLAGKGKSVVPLTMNQPKEGGSGKAMLGMEAGTSHSQRQLPGKKGKKVVPLGG